METRMPHLTKIFIAVAQCLLLGSAHAGAPQPFAVRPAQVMGVAPAEVSCDVGDLPPAASPADEAAVQQILDKIKAEPASRTFDDARNVFMWWIRLTGEIGLASVPLAGHETLHYINKRIRSCKGNATLFILDGHEYSVGVERTATPNYSILMAEWPVSRLKSGTNDRFNRYVVSAGQHKGNDLYALLDEAAAYATGAAIEVALLSQFPRSDLMQGLPDGSKLDGQLGGAVDFAAYLGYYLIATKKADPGIYQAITADQGTRALACDSLRKISSTYDAYKRLSAAQSSAILLNNDNLSDVQSGAAGEALKALRCGE